MHKNQIRYLYCSFVFLHIAVFSFSQSTGEAGLSIGIEKLKNELFKNGNDSVGSFVLFYKNNTATHQNNQSNSLPATAENTG